MNMTSKYHHQVICLTLIITNKPYDEESYGKDAPLSPILFSRGARDDCNAEGQDEEEDPNLLGRCLVNHFSLILINNIYKQLI